MIVVCAPCGDSIMRDARFSLPLTPPIAMRRASLIQFWARAGEATLPNVTSTATHNTGNRLTWRVIRIFPHLRVLSRASDSRDADGSCQKTKFLCCYFEMSTAIYCRGLLLQGTTPMDIAAKIEFL